MTNKIYSEVCRLYEDCDFKELIDIMSKLSFGSKEAKLPYNGKDKFTLCKDFINVAYENEGRVKKVLVHILTSDEVTNLALIEDLKNGT